MRAVTMLLVSAIAIGGGVAAADQGRGANAGQKASVAPVTIAFSTHDAGLIRTHYASRYRNLPPGLQKKLARGGTLPPGWEKKLEPFPAALERTLIALPGGHKRGVMDGHAVIYNPITHAILDIVALF